MSTNNPYICNQCGFNNTDKKMRTYIIVIILLVMISLLIVFLVFLPQIEAILIFETKVILLMIAIVIGVMIPIVLLSLMTIYQRKKERGLKETEIIGIER